MNFKSWNELLGNEFSPLCKIETNLIQNIGIQTISIHKESTQIDKEFAEKMQIQDIKKDLPEELPEESESEQPETMEIIPVQTQQFEVKRGLFGKLKVREV